jgi:hypothetical protein
MEKSKVVSGDINFDSHFPLLMDAMNNFENYMEVTCEQMKVYEEDGLRDFKKDEKVKLLPRFEHELHQNLPDRVWETLSKYNWGFI